MTLEKARDLLAQGELNSAKELLSDIIKDYPESSELQNNLGVIFYRQHYYEESLKHFIAALKLKPDYIDAMYNLALAYNALERRADAAASLHAIIAVEPNNIRAYFLLGKIFLEEKRYSEVGHYFKKIIALCPDDTQNLKGILQVLLTHDRYKEAKLYCEALLKLEPKSVEALYNLAIIATRCNEFEKAKNYYHAALQVDPTYFPALNNLAIYYLAHQNSDAAKYYFEQALKQEPNNQSIKYSLNAISGNGAIDDAPKQYIQSLFDSYADHYEQHLTQGLDYVVPQNLKALLGKKLKDKPQYRILDLGCGTGLCGPLFKQYASELIGVDLSPKMLKFAKEKGCYDVLIEAENSEYLADKSERFDLILAADVFIYQGNLKKSFSHCFKALVKSGFLAFSTEINQGQEFSLQPTGRFSHAKSYIVELSREIGFKSCATVVEESRSQHQAHLKGYYFLMQK